MKVIAIAAMAGVLVAAAVQVAAVTAPWPVPPECRREQRVEACDVEWRIHVTDVRLRDDYVLAVSLLGVTAALGLGAGVRADPLRAALVAGGISGAFAMLAIHFRAYLLSV